MKKRITSILLLVCMIFTMLPMAVSAEGETPVAITKVEATIPATAIPAVGENLADKSVVKIASDANYTVESLTWEYVDTTNQSQNAGTAAKPNKVYMATVTFKPAAGYEFIANVGCSIVVEGSGFGARLDKVDENGNAIFKITYDVTGKEQAAPVDDSHISNLTSGWDDASTTTVETINTTTKSEKKENGYVVINGNSITIKDGAADAYEYAVAKIVITNGKDATAQPKTFDANGVITGLAANTKYRLYIRRSETDECSVSGVKTVDFATQLTAQKVNWAESVTLAYDSKLKVATLFTGATGTVTFAPVGNWADMDVKWDATNKEITTGGITGSVVLKVTAAGSATVAIKEHYYTINVQPRTTNTTTVKVTQADTTYGIALPDYIVKNANGFEFSSVTYIGIDNDFISTGSKGVAAEKPTEAGEYEVIVTYINGSISYTASDKFEIKKKDIATAKVNLDNATLTYDRTPKTKNVANIVLSGYDLNLAEHCEISGNTATEAGTYTLTITAKPGTNYTGSVTAKYTINPKYLAGNIKIEGMTEYSATYTGEEIKPSISFEDTDIDPRDVLEIDKDYTVVYKNNVNAGNRTASITVDMTPTCNYAFTQPVTVYFTIEKAEKTCDTLVTSEVLVNTAAKNKSVNLGNVAKEIFGLGAKVTNVTRVSYTESAFSAAPAYNANTATMVYSTNKVATAGTIAEFTFDVVSTNYKTKTMTLKINVADALNADIKLAGIPEEVVYGDKDFKVTATATVPGTGTGKWTWSVEGDALKIVSGADTATPVIKVADVGDAKLVAEYVSGNFDARDTVTATVKVEKGTITITANSYTIGIGGTIPTLTTTSYTVTGMAEGDHLIRTPAKVEYVTKPDSSKAGVFVIATTKDAILPNDTQYKEIVYADGYLVVKSAANTILHFVTYGNPISSIVKDGAFTQTLTGFTPVREGYVFDGWYKDAALTTKITSITVAANTQAYVYAKWIKADATLVFNTNGGSKINPIVKAVKFTENLKSYVPVREGYEFKGWYEDEKLTKPVTSVTVDKAKTVTVYAKWDAGKATLKFETNGGTEITAISKEKAFTQKLSQYVVTRTGYDFAGWYSDAALTTKISTVDVKVGQTVTVYAKWTKKTFANPFPDVSINDWFYSDVMYVAERGYMNGIDGLFAPAKSLRRAEIVTVLYRLAGSPKVNVECAFTDIVTGGVKHWAYDAIVWASANGIVNGKSATSFDPEGALRREEMAAILYRYATYANVSTAKSANLANYADGANVNDWAKDAFAWSMAEGIIAVRDGALAPQADATRAEIAKALHAFDLLLNK